MIKQIIILSFIFIFPTISIADETKDNGIKSLALYYDEIEEGVEAQHMRYLINDRFLRIDDGSQQADFILFDVKKEIIFSVNHEDKTILKIEHNKWQQPVFDFKPTIDIQLLKNAPKINQQSVYNYLKKVNQKTCTQVYFIKNKYLREMKVQQLYQQVLSGQQVLTLANTPMEFHTPCYLVDQVYHSGDYYQQGLPVQIVYSRGYAKYLKSYKEMVVKSDLFLLPENYQTYFAFKG